MASETIRWLVLSLLYAHLMEYALHRWLMHKPTFGRRWWYTDHAVEHHGKARNDLNISIAWHTVLGFALPLLAGCYWLGAWWAACIVMLSWGYALTWTVLHHAHHNLSCLWLVRLPLYGYFRRHHLGHHDQPNCNFGAVFPWTDYLFGTVALKAR